ncbi:hypothetical protein PV392_27640 [Streptomyces sp. ME03-5709C]|nr:hypothetical protein [Streptomyces sp. ME03-5709C]
MNKRTTGSITLAIIVTLMTGCSTSEGSNSVKTSGSGPEPAAQKSSAVDRTNWPPATPRNGLAKGLSLPLEEYMQTYQDTVALADAAHRLQADCMADYGFTVTLPPAGTTPPPNDNDANIERRYGITDHITAGKYGYGLPEELQHQQRLQMPKMSQDEIEVFTGFSSLNPGEPNRSPAPSIYKGKHIPKNGCAGLAEEQIGAKDLDFFLVSELDGRSLTQSQETPEVQKAIADWSQCMNTKGYAVDTPYHANDLITHVDGAVSDEEIDVALADIDCKDATNLVKIWFDTETRIQNQQIIDNRSELTQAKERNSDALIAATKIVDSE